MGALERFLNDRADGIPPLLKAGLAHVQFESIHPFLDGNGRLGRLLITLILCDAGVLREPLLYLSLYLKQHRQQYYDLLQRVRERGDWEAWLGFFLVGVRETAEEAADTARRLFALFEEDRGRIVALRRAAASARRLHTLLQRTPMLSVPAAAERLGLSRPTVAKSMAHLERLDIVREVTSRRRGRLFVYRRYVDLLSAGTAPLRR
jgi:Fic family protein